ncbi:MAG: SDR family oxidoreductase [Pseudomonadota bacterium]|nr:SDR family oxidoreductase [Pseudomonadota bacterium]
MSNRLKPVAEQVVVITGASSGIGLATARRASEMGARLVLAARNGSALDEICAAINDRGGKAMAVTIDIADHGAAERIAEQALAAFGGFDCWVNNAAVAMFAPLTEVTLEEHRRVFDVGYFGYVQGSLAAVRHLRDKGGTLINVGSILSDRAVPLQGPYSAMKAAVMAFTDALRMELENDGSLMAVTLIKPSAIDTPYIEHARNKLDAPARPPPPPAILYDVELVAKAICFAASNRRRSLTVGGSGLMLTALAPLQPRLTDLFLEEMLDEEGQTGDTPPEPGAYDNLFEPRADGRTASNQDRPVRGTSLYLEAQMHPLATAALVGGAAALAGGAVWLLRDRERHKDAAAA